MSYERNWLVRTSTNSITGPHKREQLLEMISAGKLGSQDEVCPGTGYWFYLSESVEVRAQLGVEPPASTLSAAYVEDEITQTQTQTDGGEGDDYPEIDVVEAKGAGASVMRRAKSRVVPVAPIAASVAPARSRGRSVESTSVWKGIAWALIVIVAVLLVGVFRALQRTG